MMEFELLGSFVAVAECGGFHRGAALIALRERELVWQIVYTSPSLTVSAPQPWLVSRSRRFRRARLSPDFAFSARKAASPFCRLLSLRSSRGSGLTRRRQRSPRCLSRSVKPRTTDRRLRRYFQNQTCAERSSLKTI